MLKKFGDNFSFISSDPLFIDSLVTKSILEAKERCDEKDSDTFYKTSLLCLKRNIRESINKEYDKDRDGLFSRLLKSKILKRNIEKEKKMQIFSSVIGSIKTPIERSFYEKLISNNRCFDLFLTDFYIKDENGKLKVDENLTAIYPHLKEVAEEYVKHKINGSNKSNPLYRRIDVTKFDIPREEINDYYKRILDGDNNAKKDFALLNDKLVKSIAMEYSNDKIPFEEIVQQGYIGLMIAIKKYNPKRGFAFSTYATWWILNGIKRYTYKNRSLINFAYYKMEDLLSLQKMITEEESIRGELLNDYDIMDIFGLSREEVDIYNFVNTDLISLSKCTYIDENEFEEEVQVNDKENQYEELFSKMRYDEILECAKNCLTEREYKIFSMRFCLSDRKCSCEEVSKILGLTRERVRQIDEIILEVLRGQKDIYKYKEDSQKTKLEKKLEEICGDNYDVLAYIRYSIGLNSKTPLCHAVIKNRMRLPMDKVDEIRFLAVNLLSDYEELETVYDLVKSEKTMDGTFKSKTIVDKLREDYSDSEIGIILSSLKEEDLAVLRERYGKDFASVNWCSKSTQSLANKIVLRKIPFVAEVNGIEKSKKKVVGV